MDVLTIQWGWFGGGQIAIEPPVYQPAPAARRIRVEARDRMAEPVGAGERVIIVGPEDRGQ